MLHLLMPITTCCMHARVLMPCRCYACAATCMRTRIVHTCMQGYERLGFTREGSATVYREWCPAAAGAQLMGDFNSWSGAWMQRDDFGVWKIVLPDGAGLPSCVISTADPPP